MMLQEAPDYLARFHQVTSYNYDYLLKQIKIGRLQCYRPSPRKIEVTPAQLDRWLERSKKN